MWAVWVVCLLALFFAFRKLRAGLNETLEQRQEVLNKYRYLMDILTHL